MIIATISAMVAVAVVLAIGAQRQREINARGGCPKCSAPVPQFRRPTSWQQAMWGGWTCECCRAEMDSYGN